MLLWRAQRRCASASLIRSSPWLSQQRSVTTHHPSVCTHRTCGPCTTHVQACCSAVLCVAAAASEADERDRRPAPRSSAAAAAFAQRCGCNTLRAHAPCTLLAPAGSLHSFPVVCVALLSSVVQSSRPLAKPSSDPCSGALLTTPCVHLLLVRACTCPLQHA